MKSNLCIPSSAYGDSDCDTTWPSDQSYGMPTISVGRERDLVECCLGKVYAMHPGSVLGDVSDCDGPYESVADLDTACEDSDEFFSAGWGSSDDQVLSVSSSDGNGSDNEEWMSGEEEDNTCELK